MDIRITKMRETTTDFFEPIGHHFEFKNDDGETIVTVSWFVDLRAGEQSLVLEMVNGETEQFKRLVNTYLGAKTFAEQFDLHMITFLFEQYALKENIDIICD